jgi:hypothetical protein
MVWAKVAVAGGMLLVLAAFGLGTQPRSASVGQETYSCGATFAASWLVPGPATATFQKASSAAWS